MKKLDVKEYSFKKLTELAAQGIEHIDAIAKSFEADGKSATEAKTTVRDSALVMGKVLCVLETALNKGKEAKVFAPNMSLADFYASKYGQKPQTHVLTLKNTFGGFVQTSIISEDDYDRNSNNCLELAGRILTAVQGDLTHEAVAKAAHELKTRDAKNEAKNLRAILSGLKPKEKMTPERAIEMVHEIAGDGHLNLVPGEIADIVGASPAATQKEIYFALCQAMETIEKKVGGPDVIDAWVAERTEQSADAPLKVITETAAV